MTGHSAFSELLEFTLAAAHLAALVCRITLKTSSFGVFILF